MTILIGGVLSALLIWMLMKILKTSMKLAWKLLLNALGGVISLFILNLFGGLVGLTLDITWFNAIVAGILGLPGIILLLIIKYI